MHDAEFPPYDVFYSKFRIGNPVEAEDNDSVDPLLNGITTEQALLKLKLPKPPSTGVRDYQYPQQT